MAMGLLDEGAGPYDSQAFRAQLEDNAIRLHFDADRDGLSGELKTLSAQRDHAFELLRLALHEPRFDEEPVERVRGQITAELRRLEAEPNYLASRAWFERPSRATPMAGRPAARPRRWPPSPATSSQASPPAASAATISASACPATSRAEALAPLLDHAFGDLASPGVRPEPRSRWPR